MKAEKLNKSLYLQVRIDPEERRKLEEIAAYNGVTLSGQLRIWINKQYSRLPKKD